MILRTVFSATAGGAVLPLDDDVLGSLSNPAAGGSLHDCVLKSAPADLPALGRKAVNCIRVRRIRTRRELQRAFSIRLRVFVEEQGVPREMELDEDDPSATHFVATTGGKAVGTARLVIRRGAAKIGRMAVLKAYRNRTVGQRLLKRAVSYARKEKAKIIFLNAQVPVVAFYEKMGFHVVGGRFTEAGIVHRRMVLSDDQRRNH